MTDEVSGRNDLKFNTDLKNLDSEIDVIGNNTKIHELIKLFSIHGITVIKNGLDYFSITVENGSKVLFELEMGCIWWIIFAPFSGILQNKKD